MMQNNTHTGCQYETFGLVSYKEVVPVNDGFVSKGCIELKFKANNIFWSQLQLS